MNRAYLLLSQWSREILLLETKMNAARKKAA
jgi:hypothetical protein